MAGAARPFGRNGRPLSGPVQDASRAQVRRTSVYPSQPCQSDTGDDGLGDRCASCYWLYDPDQTDASGDGLGHLRETDQDEDDVPDQIDTCARTFNPDQVDLDEDGTGDAGQPRALGSQAWGPAVSCWTRRRPRSSRAANRCARPGIRIGRG